MKKLQRGDFGIVSGFFRDFSGFFRDLFFTASFLKFNASHFGIFSGLFRDFFGIFSGFVLMDSRTYRVHFNATLQVLASWRLGLAVEPGQLEAPPTGWKPKWQEVWDQDNKENWAVPKVSVFRCNSRKSYRI